MEFATSVSLCSFIKNKKNLLTRKIRFIVNKIKLD